MGWDVNVHVNLRQDVNVHVNGTRFTNLIQVCALPEAGTRMMVMMMMMMMMLMMMMMMTMLMMMMKMTQIKLVNSGTKFRPGMDKFSQPNSGGPQFQKRGRGYIYIHIPYDNPLNIPIMSALYHQY